MIKDREGVMIMNKEMNVKNVNDFPVPGINKQFHDFSAQVLTSISSLPSSCIKCMIRRALFQKSRINEK